MVGLLRSFSPSYLVPTCYPKSHLFSTVTVRDPLRFRLRSTLIHSWLLSTPMRRISTPDMLNLSPSISLIILVGPEHHALYGSLFIHSYPSYFQCPPLLRGMDFAPVLSVMSVNFDSVGYRCPCLILPHARECL